jgi:hypothetical protein
MITIVAVRPNIGDNVLSRQWNFAHLDHVKNGYLAARISFESEAPFPYKDIKKLQNHPSHFLKRNHVACRRFAPIGRLNEAHCCMRCRQLSECQG